MLTIKKEEGELLGVNKASIFYKKNKTDEVGVRMLFKYAPVATEFFIYKANGDGYLFSESEIKGEKALFKRVVMALKMPKNVSLYINMKNLITEETYFSIRKVSQGFLLLKSTDQEIKSFSVKTGRHDASGYITRANMFNVVKSDRDKLNEYGLDYVMRLHYGEKMYIELFCIENANDYPTLFEAEQTNQLESGFRVEPISGMSFYLPRKFIKEGNVQTGDKLETWFNEECKMIIEVKDVICELCGKPIRRYHEGVNIIHVSHSCKNALPAVSAVVKNSEGTNSSEKMKNAAESINLLTVKLNREMELLKQKLKEKKYA